MVLTREYRICMPLTVEEYRIGQLYMIARHSHEQSHGGEGVEVVENKECTDPVHGKGHYTEKRIHISSRLPYWLQSVIPKIFYVTEKAWNYYPYTETEYTCSFLPKFQIFIKTRYEDNNGSSENSINLSLEELSERVVQFLDIAYDDIDARYYKEDEDPCFFRSEKTGRGPLVEGWRDTVKPVMCSYKFIKASFEVWGLQSKVEEFMLSTIQHTLLLGHRQAFAWIDEWIDMSLDDAREYENRMQTQTNATVTGRPVTLSPADFEVSNQVDSASSSNKSWFSWL